MTMSKRTTRAGASPITVRLTYAEVRRIDMLRDLLRRRLQRRAAVTRSDVIRHALDQLHQELIRGTAV